MSRRYDLARAVDAAIGQLDSPPGTQLTWVAQTLAGVDELTGRHYWREVSGRCVLRTSEAPDDLVELAGPDQHGWLHYNDWRVAIVAVQRPEGWIR